MKLETKKKVKTDIIIEIVKIIVISYFAIYVLGNFVPYYEGDDSYVFGVAGLNIADGKYAITNELLLETGDWHFVPRHWSKTVDNQYIPNVDVGFPALLSFAYSIFGYYGMFYAGPIIAIGFLITIERISTKIVNKEAGLFVVLLFVSNTWFVNTSLHAMSDILFSLLFAIGAFFLVRTIQTKDKRNVFLATLFLVSASFFRIVGVVAFPIEIIVLLYTFRDSIKTKNIRSLVIISPIVLWLVFFAFYLSFNNLYFGDPLTTYVDVGYDRTLHQDISNQPNTFESIRGYFKSVLPFPLSSDLYDIPDSYNDIFGKYWIGYISIVLFVFTLFFVFKKSKNAEILSLFLLFIIMVVSFYSVMPNAESALERAVSKRYMIPVYMMSFTIIAIMLRYLWNFLDKKNHKYNIYKISLACGVGLFIIGSFYASSSFEAIKSNEFELKNPEEHTKRYQAYKEGLTSKDVILDSKGYITPEIGAIPFTAPTSIDFNQNNQTLNMLQKIIDDGYDVYILKDPSRQIDKEFFRYLDKNGFSFTIHSSSFCKIIDNDSLVSNKACL